MSGSPSKTPSIRDVARAAGVSVATASRVLAKTAYPVAEATRDRVNQAARTLGFVPNAVARALSRSQTDSIGVVAPRLVNPYYGAMVEGVDRAATESGLTMLLGLSGGSEARRDAIIDDLLRRRVDGLIVCAGADDHVPIRPPDQLGVPAVLIGQQANSGHPIIKTDNRRAGFEAAEYLWRLGHRRFAYLTGPESWHDFHERGQGMIDYLRGAGESFEVTVLGGLFGEADSYRRVRDLCAAGLPATALLASTDRHALGALAALSDAGVDVPRDVSVMGFDDYVSSGFLRPALTTMQVPSAEMGRLAVERLRASFGGEMAPFETLLTATRIERMSTAPKVTPQQTPP